MKRFILATSLALGLAPAAHAEEAAPVVAVVPYCASPMELVCELFVEYLEQSESFEIVQPMDRTQNGNYIHIEITANWTEANDLIGSVKWWGKSGEEFKGVGVKLQRAPRRTEVYSHLIMIAMSSSSFPDRDSPFFAYSNRSTK